MKKPIRFYMAMVIIFVAFIFAGCAPHYSMPSVDMSIVPDIYKAPEKITVAVFNINPVLDLAEGGEGRISWPAYMQDTNGTEYKLLALQVGYMLTIVIPNSKTELIGNRLAVFSRDGRLVYNENGEAQKLKSPRSQVDLSSLGNFIPEITQDSTFVYEVINGSQEYKDLLDIYREFRIEEISLVRDYVYKNYGSSFTEEELNKISADDSLVNGFAKWLGEDWHLIFTYPLISPEAIGFNMLIAKVFTLPSIWGSRLNKPGYLQHITDAERTAEITLRALQRYSANNIQTGKGTPLPPNLRKQIFQSTGINFETYEAFNLYAIKQNAQ